jgi:2-methylisocitrate lyase-like PEP mutase family enzyme
MSANFKKFKDLHQSAGLFVLPNAWNVKSALLLQENDFPAVATSSGAVASTLGYADGGGLPFDDYLFVIKRMLASIQIPLSVDMETGYGTSAENIYANIRKLIDLGVAGVNIEDSIVTESGRVLTDATILAKTIEYSKNRLAAENMDLFINIRCDTFNINAANKKQETNIRMRLYEAAGADGIFLPRISAEEDIAEAVSNTQLPLNVISVPGLPGFATLNKLGVKRVSLGPFLFNKTYAAIGQLARAITANKSVSPLFN